MLHKAPCNLVMAVALVGLCISGLAAPVWSQDGGFNEGTLPPDREVEVPVPDSSIDGEEELNPVSQATLEDLAVRRGSEADETLPASAVHAGDGGPRAVTGEALTVTANIFAKYALLPDCTSFGCPGGIDHLAAGTGLRNMRSGTIRFRGAPPGAVPVSGFLYFAFIHSGPLANPLQVVFNGTAVHAFLVANPPNPCWGFGGSLRVYRAPVLPFILPGINGDYSVSGVPSNLATGQNPWNPVNNSFPLAEGASLVILYTHSSITVGTQVQIHHPLVMQVTGTSTYTHFLNLPIRSAATKHTRLGADGQVGGGTANANSLTNERTSLAGPVPASFVQIRGDGSYASGNEDADWNGTDGEPLNQLWDTHTMDIPGVIAAGLFVSNYRVRYQMGNDCVVPVAHVLTYR